MPSESSRTKPTAEEFPENLRAPRASIKGGGNRVMSAEGARRGMVDAPNLSGKRTEQRSAKLFRSMLRKNNSTSRRQKWKQ